MKKLFKKIGTAGWVALIMTVIAGVAVAGYFTLLIQSTADISLGEGVSVTWTEPWNCLTGDPAATVTCTETASGGFNMVATGFQDVVGANLRAVRVGRNNSDQKLCLTSAGLDGTDVIASVTTFNFNDPLETGSLGVGFDITALESSGTGGEVLPAIELFIDYSSDGVSCP